MECATLKKIIDETNKTYVWVKNRYEKRINDLAAAARDALIRKHRMSSDEVHATVNGCLHKELPRIWKDSWERALDELSESLVRDVEDLSENRADEHRVVHRAQEFHGQFTALVVAQPANLAVDHDVHLLDDKELRDNVGDEWPVYSLFVDEIQRICDHLIKLRAETFKQIARRDSRLEDAVVDLASKFAHDEDVCGAILEVRQVLLLHMLC